MTIESDRPGTGEEAGATNQDDPAIRTNGHHTSTPDGYPSFADQLAAQLAVSDQSSKVRRAADEAKMRRDIAARRGQDAEELPGGPRSPETSLAPTKFACGQAGGDDEADRRSRTFTGCRKKSGKCSSDTLIPDEGIETPPVAAADDGPPEPSAESPAPESSSSDSEPPVGVAGGSEDDADDDRADDGRQSEAGDAVVQRLDDAFIGAYLADQYLSDFVYAVGLGWLKFDGRRWATSSSELVGEAIRLAVIDFHGREARAGRDHLRLKRIDGLLSAGKLRALQGIARNRLCRMAHEFDNHPDLLNVGNGVVDLRDGTIRPHDRELLLTTVTEVGYWPGAAHPDWDQALAALPDDSQSWAQVRLGQGLTGYPTPDDKLPVLRGAGANGKTTVVDAVRRAVGDDYAVMMPERVLLARPGDHPTELMTLRGARLALMEEFPELGHLNAKRLKDLHGTGQMSARFCGQDTVHWSPTHTAVVTTNYLPRVDESDHGTWRRLVLVEFPYRYVGSAEQIRIPIDRVADPNLRERLRHGNDGQPEAVLAWLIEGAVKWHQGGRIMPTEPESVREATQRWRGTADLVMRYLAERLVFDPASCVVSTELYADFSDWLTDNGHRPWTDRNFTARLAQHSEVTEHGVAKKIIRSSHPGNVSRLPRRRVTAAPEKPLGKQFTAWLGVRFRTEDDVTESFDELG